LNRGKTPPPTEENFVCVLAVMSAKITITTFAICEITPGAGINCKIGNFTFAGWIISEKRYIYKSESKITMGYTVIFTLK